MQLTERIEVRKTPVLSLLCHRAKNLYNLANFYVRQELFHLENVLTYYDLDFILRKQQAYKVLPAQTAQQVLRQVAGDWRSFFAASRAYRRDPRRFRGAPRPPRYRPKGGESIVMFTNQQCQIVGGWLRFPRKASLPLVKTRVTAFQQVRVVPKESCYVVEVVYNVEPTDLRLDKRRALGIDLGVANLVTAANNVGLPPFAVKGGAAKSVNQFFNKRIARFRSIAARANGILTTKRISRLSMVRANKLGDIFHKTSRAVVDFCVRHDIGTIAIGTIPVGNNTATLGEEPTRTSSSCPSSSS